MHFLGSLGIDWKLLIAQMVNFGLLLWLLKKFFYQPIIERIEIDEKTMLEAQTLKESLEKDRKAFAVYQQTETTKVKERASEIIKEAENIAKELEARTLKEAETERQAVVAQIRSRLEDIDHAETNKK